MFEDKDVIKILSIDGGGIRGIIPVTILAEIENRCGKQIYELFDFIAGTSTGGLLTLFLNKKNPAPAAALTELYVKHGKDIFPQKPVDNSSWKNMFKDKIKNTLTDYLSGPKYKVAGIEQILRYLVKNETYDEMIKPCLITSYETENNKAVFFTNYTERYKKVLIRDIARATSAAPTYFEPLNASISSNVVAILCTGIKFSSNLTPTTTPPLFIIFSDNNAPIPPEALSALFSLSNL